MRFWLWWSFYAKARNRRRFKAGPLRELEKRLGHRIKVWGCEPDFSKRPGVIHVDASSWIEAPSVDAARVFLIEHVQKFAKPLNQAWAVERTPEPTERDALLNLYWDLDRQIGIPQIFNSGVELSFASDKPGVEAYCDPAKTERSGIASSALITARQLDGGLGDFQLDWSVRLATNNKSKLIQKTWPSFRDQNFSEPVEVLQVKDPNQEGDPFVLTVRQYLRGVTAESAIAHCLSAFGRHYVRLETASDRTLLSLATDRSYQLAEPTGIMGYSLKPVAKVSG